MRILVLALVPFFVIPLSGCATPARDPGLPASVATEVDPLQALSISDNTATDHLLFAPGRDRVEAALGGAPKTTLPFLSTAEAFRLESHDALAARWRGMTATERRALLVSAVASLPFGPYSPTPNISDTIGWFYSTSDLCRVIGELGRRGSEVRGILGVNTPFLEPEMFTWLGYKGGSQPAAVR